MTARPMRPMSAVPGVTSPVSLPAADRRREGTRASESVLGGQDDGVAGVVGPHPVALRAGGAHHHHQQVALHRDRRSRRRAPTTAGRARRSVPSARMERTAAAASSAAAAAVVEGHDHPEGDRPRPGRRRRPAPGPTPLASGPQGTVGEDRRVDARLLRGRGRPGEAGGRRPGWAPPRRRRRSGPPSRRSRGPSRGSWSSRARRPPRPRRRTGVTRSRLVCEVLAPGVVGDAPVLRRGEEVGPHRVGAHRGVDGRRVEVASQDLVRSPARCRR